MDEHYWEMRDAMGCHNLLNYAHQLSYAVVARDEPAIELAIKGIQMAQTMRQIASYELTALRTPAIVSPLFGKGR